MPLRRTTRAVLLATLVAAAGRSAAAQVTDDFALQGDTTLIVDRIVAVVGNQPILGSQVEEQFVTVLSGQGAPTLASASDSLALRRRILEDMINEEILVQEALRDTAVKVTESDWS